MKSKQITCVEDVRCNLSNLCCLPPEKCVGNLHDNNKFNMAAIANKVYSLESSVVTIDLRSLSVRRRDESKCSKMNVVWFDPERGA